MMLIQYFITITLTHFITMFLVLVYFYYEHFMSPAEALYPSVCLFMSVFSYICSSC